MTVFYIPAGIILQEFGGKIVKKKDMPTLLNAVEKNNAPKPVKKVEKYIIHKINEVLAKKESVKLMGFYARLDKNSILLKVGPDDNVEFWVENLLTLPDYVYTYISFLRSQSKNNPEVKPFNKATEAAMRFSDAQEMQTKQRSI